MINFTEDSNLIFSESNQTIENIILEIFKSEIIESEKTMDVLTALIKMTTKKVFINFESKNKQESYSYLERKCNRFIKLLKKDMKKYDMSSLIHRLICYEENLTILSAIKLNGKFTWNEEAAKMFPQTVMLMFRGEKNDIKVETKEDQYMYFMMSRIIGEFIRGTDLLLNFALLEENNRGNNENNIYKKVNELEVLNLLIYSLAIEELNEMKNIVGKSKEFKYLKIEDFFIDMKTGDIPYYREELEKNYVEQNFSEVNSDENIAILMQLYKKELEFTPDMIRNRFRNVGIVVKEFDVFKEELKRRNSNEVLGYKGLLNLIEREICLESKTDEKEFLFDNDCRASKKGLIRIKNQVIMSNFLLYRYADLLFYKMKRQDFAKNDRINKFIKDKLVEEWLTRLKEKMDEKKLFCKIQIKEIATMIENNKPITQEIDFVIRDTKNKEILIGEYKNKSQNTFTIKQQIIEEPNLKKEAVKKQIRMLNILKENKIEFLNLLELADSEKYKLVFVAVFETRNILCGKKEFNAGIECRYYERTDFEEFLNEL